MRNTFIKQLVKSAKEYNNIFLIIGDIGFNVVEEFADTFPDRFLNAGVAEQNMTGLAAGLASEGFHVFTYSIANFPTFRCAEQIRNDIDYHNLPVTIVAVGSGVSYGNAGYSHHAVQDLGLMRMMPNTLIAAPGDPLEVEAVVDYLIQNPQPSYLRLGKSGEVNFNSKTPDVKPGKWNHIVKQPNSENAILTTGAALQWFLKKQDKFLDRNIFTMPLWGLQHKDIQDEYVRNWNSIITVEDHYKDCGFGSWFRESISFTNSNTEILNYTLPVSCMDIVESSEDIMNYMQLS